MRQPLNDHNMTMHTETLTPKPETTDDQAAKGVASSRLVRALASCIDEAPDLLKAAVVAITILNLSLHVIHLILQGVIWVIKSP